MQVFFAFTLFLGYFVECFYYVCLLRIANETLVKQRAASSGFRPDDDIRVERARR